MKHNIVQMLSFRILIMLLVVFGVSCSKKEAPGLPAVRSALLQDMFTALERQDYDDAIAKLERYKTEDPGNIFLTDLEKIIIANKYISNVKTQMNAGNMQAALDVLEQAIKKNGELPELVAVRDQLRVLVEIDSLVDRLNTPLSSDEIRQAADKLSIFCSMEPKALRIKVFADKKLQEAKILQQLEKDRLNTYLLFDAYDALNNNNTPQFQTFATVLSMQEDGEKAWKQLVKKGYLQISSDFLFPAETKNTNSAVYSE